MTQMGCYSTQWFQRYGLGQTKMAHSLTTIDLHLSLMGRHLESVGRTEPVFELTLALSER